MLVILNILWRLTARRAAIKQNSMLPLAHSSQRSSPKWIVVGRSGCQKLSHRLTAPRPVALHRGLLHVKDWWS